jgi:hypothetical protein
MMVLHLPVADNRIVEKPPKTLQERFPLGQVKRERKRERKKERVSHSPSFSFFFFLSFRLLFIVVLITMERLEK